MIALQSVNCDETWLVAKIFFFDKITSNTNARGIVAYGTHLEEGSSEFRNHQFVIGWKCIH